MLGLAVFNGKAILLSITASRRNSGEVPKTFSPFSPSGEMPNSFLRDDPLSEKTPISFQERFLCQRSPRFSFSPVFSAGENGTFFKTLISPTEKMPIDHWLPFLRQRKSSSNHGMLN
jgi:hypothetical protein